MTTDPRNTGHGHVRPRPDGTRARCGGPGLCPVCSREAATVNNALMAQAPDGPASSYAPGGLVGGLDGTTNVQIRLNPGEEVVTADGQVYRLEHRWVRINTDEQAAEWLRGTKEMLAQMNREAGA